jgi:hypothetical protein
MTAAGGRFRPVPSRYDLGRERPAPPRTAIGTSFQPTRIADRITAFAGSMPFVYLHALGFRIRISDDGRRRGQRVSVG